MNFSLNNETLLQLGMALSIFLTFIFLRKLLTNQLIKLILALTQKLKVDFGTKLILAYEKPIRWFIVIFGLYLTIKFIPFTLMTTSMEQSLLRTALIGLISWGAFNFSTVTDVLFPRLMERLDFNVDKIVIPFITKLLKTIIVTMAICMIAEEWGFNVNGFIAGLGLGGLAFALAAKETISNLFGGVVIVTEKPFTIGDWIKTPSVEGIVEDITFRSTKIRTFAQALVTVPNSTLANEPIVNWSKMGKRQITFHLGVTYSTTKQKLEKVVYEIEQMLIEHEEVHNDTIIVKFDRFNDSSLDIYMYFFTNVINFADYLNIKEDINFKIMAILEELKVDIAFPTRTLVLQSDQVVIENEKRFEALSS
ncbi:mechanosensitive ion channel family protein [Bacillus sp. 31A1R]|uniref:Mechanosensitive ion channel family protein n=1 Tax=Robertmurraya mangrovi TaxID=3098077 RepID=A0ABU5J326_9BACI|nr:mechanosensitive ion channel family protein [Bacillus sp. 31A1R]MDZ5473826.1 mechanosensitive ion channel family protein [Bacillus sp. 31A1R]